MSVKTFIAKNAIFVVSLGLLIGSSVNYLNISANSEERIGAANSKLEKALTDVNKMSARKEMNRKAVAKDAYGLDLDRKATDDKIFQKFISSATTWKSGKDYVAARKELMRKYKLTEESSFMNVFMPKKGVYREDDDGKLYFTGDFANSKFVSLSSSVIGISPNEYNYFAIVTTSTNLKGVGSHSSEGKSVVTYTVDKDGNISNIEAVVNPSELITVG